VTRSAAQRRDAGRAALVAAALACALTAAQAQLGASITAVSDYRFRGVSMSDAEPALLLGVVYDARGGSYAGASLTRVALSRGQRYTELVGYAGRVVETCFGAGWEIGAVASHFGGDASYDFIELYTGLVAERWNTRLYLSPDYFGRGVRTAYAEWNGHWPLGADVRLIGHAGVLGGLGGAAGSDSHRARLDTRLGIGISRGSADLQFAWVAASRGGPYPAVYDTRRSGWLFSASFAY
jgi:uncharacterized protein (TIGR02001 family)